jgi:excisionase family DNA binding protein
MKERKRAIEKLERSKQDEKTKPNYHVRTSSRLVEDYQIDRLERKVDHLSTLVEKLEARNGLSLKEKWFVTSEVCAILDVSLRKLQQMRTNGEILFKKSGKKIYYKSSDVQKYLDNLTSN